jgi:hypothetical protein
MPPGAPIMKVVAPRSARAADRARKASATEGPRGPFGEILQVDDAVPTRTASTAATPVAIPLIEVLTSAQIMASDPDGKSQGRARGNQLLDRLDELRLALLAGSIAADSLDALKALVASERAEIQDPGLVETLDEIELLVRVELAKLGRD